MLRELAEAAEKELGLTISLESEKSCWSTSAKLASSFAANPFMTPREGGEPMKYHQPEEGLPLLGSRWCLNGRTEAATDLRATKTWGTFYALKK